MTDLRNQASGRAHLWLRSNVLGLVAIFLAMSGTAVAVQAANEDAGSAGQKAAKKKKAKPGPRGPQGPQGPQGQQGPPGPSTGPAGGALAGNYPDPVLDVSGGPCPNGQALTNVSALAALTCATGVYRDVAGNIAVTPTAHPALAGGNSNSALGVGALAALTSGDGNTAVGSSALDSNTSGNDNTAFGESALASNDAGSANTAVGDNALINSTAGGNTAVGFDALLATTGSFNIALGPQSGAMVTAGTSNIHIGHTGSASDTNRIRIGQAQTQTNIAGIHGQTTGGAGSAVLVDSGGELGTISSSRSVKRDIEPLPKLPPLMKLRPVSFRYRSGSPELHYGLIAEQVSRLMPTLAAYGKDGAPESVQYHELPVLLLSKLQEQQRRLNRQQEQIDRLIREVRGG